MSDTNDTFTGFVDSALLLKEGAHSYLLKLGGWMLARDSRTRELLITLPSGIGVYAQLVERPDVATRIPQIPHSLYSGFSASLPVHGIEEQYILEFRAKLESGQNIVSQLHVKPEVAFHRVVASEGSAPSPFAPRVHSPFGRIDHREACIESCKMKLQSFLRSKTTWSFIPEPPASVSVIIPVCNHAELTFGCLEALRAQMIRDLEVVVVDNGSSDATKDLIARMRGVVSVIHQQNIPFAEACNAGAAVASSPFLLFLNNDAFVLPGAIEALTTTLIANPSAGAVGGKLIRPDGKIQEAGAFLLPDGTSVGRARGTLPDSRLASYQQQVDYCSAAFLLVRRDAFDAAGGFDSRFAPAYYEDVDLCVRLAQKGQLCLVEPRAEAMHIERGSAQSIGQTDSQLQRNRSLFNSLHPKLLRLPGSSSHALRQRGAAPKLLMIDDAIPDATFGQGQGRAAQILASLIASQAGETHGVQIHFYPAHDTSELSHPNGPAGVTIVRPKPFEGEIGFLRRVLPDFDAIFVSRPHHMEQVQIAIRLIPPLARVPLIIYDAEAIQAKREILRFEVLNVETLTDDEIIEVVCNEIAVARDADILITSSELEARAFIDFGFDAPRIISHSVAVSPSPTSFHNRSHILTVGPLLKEDTPNADGLLWFVTEAYPHIKNLLGNSAPSIHAVGLCQVPKISELQNKDFRLMGKIANMTTTYDNYRIFIAPTRYAAGIPIKVIEAAAHGIPCVVSPVLAAQLGWKDEEEVLVGYDAADFGAKCAALYVNEKLWSDLRNCALARVAEQFSPSEFQKAIHTLTSDIALSSRQSES